MNWLEMPILAKGSDTSVKKRLIHTCKLKLPRKYHAGLQVAISKLKYVAIRIRTTYV